MIELYFEVFPNLQSWTGCPMYQFDEHNQMPWLWTLVPYNVIFEPLLYLPKRKKNLSSFDNCFRTLLVKSKAQQSRLCVCIKAFPERAAKCSIVTSWTSQRMELRWSCEVGLSGSTTCFLLPVMIKLSKYSQYSLSVCYLRFHTWLNFFKQGILVVLLALYCILADSMHEYVNSADEQFRYS